MYSDVETQRSTQVSTVVEVQESPRSVTPVTDQTIAGVIRALMDVGNQGQYTLASDRELRMTGANGNIEAQPIFLPAPDVARINLDDWLMRDFRTGGADVVQIQHGLTVSRRVMDAIGIGVASYESAARAYSGGATLGESVQSVSDHNQLRYEVPGDRGDPTEGSFLHVANELLDSGTREQVENRLRGSFSYGSAYYNPHQPVRAAGTEFTETREVNYGVSVMLDGMKLKTTELAVGGEAAGSYTTLLHDKGQITRKVMVRHNGMRQLAQRGAKSEPELRRMIANYVDTTHVKESIHRNSETDMAVRGLLYDHVMLDSVGRGQEYALVTTIREDQCGVVINTQSIKAEHDDDGDTVYVIHAVLQLRPRTLDSKLHDYSIVAPAVCVLTTAEFADDTHVRVYNLDNRGGRDDLARSKIITYYNVRDSAAVTFGGMSTNRRRRLPLNEQNRAEILRMVYVQGVTESDRLTRIQSGLLTHDPWTGLPYQIRGQQGARELAYSPSIRLTMEEGRLHVSLDSYKPPITHTTRCRLHHSGVEFNSLLRYYRTGENAQNRIKEWYRLFVSVVAENAMLQRDMIMRALGDSAQYEDDFEETSAIIEAYLNRQYVDSYITTEHRVIVGSGDSDVTPEMFKEIQCARMYLSLYYVRMKNEYSLGQLPKRYLTASLLPISLTSSGYLVYGVGDDHHSQPDRRRVWPLQTHLLSFFKEYFATRHARYRIGSLESALQYGYSERQWDAIKAQAQPQVIGRITARPINVKGRSDFSNYSHVIDLGYDEFISLDPIINDVMTNDGALPDGTMGFIYDSRYVILAYRSSLEGSKVYISTTARSARIIPHTKNVGRGEMMMHDGVRMFVGTTAQHLEGNLTALKQVVHTG